MLDCRPMPSPYIITLADPAQIPGLIKGKFLMGYAQPRIAFVGRSNVGKSSLINALVREKIARVSATPGKTRAIHFFLWEKVNKIIADLPGYGFAKVAKDEQKEWSKLMDGYFKADEGVEVVLILFDGRHGPTEQDLDALSYFGKKGRPIQIIMTKFDQLKTQSDRARRKKEVTAALAPFSIPPEHLFWISIKDQKTLQWLRDTFV